MGKSIRPSTPLFIMPCALPWDWPADYEKQTAQELARRGYTVIVYLHQEARFFLKKSASIYPKTKNIVYYKPIYAIPFKRFAVVEKLNQHLNMQYLLWKYGAGSSVVLWIFNHLFASFPTMVPKNVMSVYDCVEYPSSLDKALNEKIEVSRKKLLHRSTYIFVDSPTLANALKEYHPIRVPQGFDMQTFMDRKLRFGTRLPFPVEKPVIGYAGNINYRLDLPLLYDLIRKNPQWSFVFVGDVQWYPSEDKYVHTAEWLKKMYRLKNISFFPRQPRQKLISSLRYFDVCLIPYNVTIPFNRYSRAMKMYEYFFFGKPIVSTPILESVRHKQVLSIGNDSLGFEKRIKKLLRVRISKKVVQSQKRLCFENAWERKVDSILDTIAFIERRR